MANFIDLMKKRGIPNFIQDSDIKLLLNLKGLKKLDELIPDLVSFDKRSKSLNYIIDHQDIVDIDKLYLLNAYLIGEMLGRNSKEFKKAMEIISPKLKKGIIFIDFAKLNGSIRKDDITFITYDSIMDSTNKNTDKYKENLEYIDENYDISSMMDFIMLEDIGLSLRNDKIDDEASKYCIATTLKSRVLFNSVLKQSNMTHNDLIRLMGEDEEKFLSLGKKYVNTEKGLEEIMEVLSDYSEYIDFDKLLMMSAYRSIEFIETRNASDDTIEQAKKNLINVKRYFDEKSKNRKNYSVVFYEATDRRNNGERSKINYSYKSLVKDIEKFVGKEYIGEEKRKEYIEKIKNGELKITDLSEELVRALNFTKEELKECGENSKENYFYYLNELNGEEIKTEIESKDELSDDVLMYLYERKALSSDEIISLYMKGKISLNAIMEINSKNNMETQISNEKLIDYYKKYKENEKSVDCVKDFNRYMLLYKNIKLSGKTEEEQEIIMEELVEDILLNTDIQYPENSTKSERRDIESEFQKTVLKDFYKNGIISLKIATDWIGEEFANELFEQRALNPADIKKLLKDKKITLDLIKKMLNSEMKTAEKLDFIYSIFDGDSQEEFDIKNKLIQYLKLGKGMKEESSGIHKEKGTNSVSSNKYITDPSARWRLMSLLDKKYSKELLYDGHAVFHLPNIENGQVVIEKMFETKKDGTVPSYGQATYILSEDEFINNDIIVIVDGQRVIDRKKLMALAKEGKAKKIVHSLNWGKALKSHLGIKKESSKYSKEDIEQIDKTIEKIEKSRTLMV